MSEAVETCGKAYCEHYPDGLFVCAKCREESTLAHDRACAKIAEAQADADHWKGECNALQRMVHEARAEIERLRARNAMLDNAIAEMTEEQAALCAEGQTITELVASKDRLIEQMREALRAITNLGMPVCRKEHRIARAALAAERGDDYEIQKKADCD